MYLSSAFFMAGERIASICEQPKLKPNGFLIFWTKCEKLIIYVSISIHPSTLPICEILPRNEKRSICRVFRLGNFCGYDKPHQLKVHKSVIWSKISTWFDILGCEHSHQKKRKRKCKRKWLLWVKHQVCDKRIKAKSKFGCEFSCNFSPQVAKVKSIYR